MTRSFPDPALDGFYADFCQPPEFPDLILALVLLVTAVAIASPLITDYALAFGL